MHATSDVSQNSSRKYTKPDCVFNQVTVCPDDSQAVAAQPFGHLQHSLGRSGPSASEGFVSSRLCQSNHEVAPQSRPHVLQLTTAPTPALLLYPIELLTSRRCDRIGRSGVQHVVVLPRYSVSGLKDAD